MRPVDHAEPVALGVGEDDGVGIVGVGVPSTRSAPRPTSRCTSAVCSAAAHAHIVAAGRSGRCRGARRCVTLSAVEPRGDGGAPPAGEVDRTRHLARRAEAVRRRAEDLLLRKEALADALARTSRTIADTETRLAETLDQLAETRPEDGERLRREAREAREFASRERDRAAERGADRPS
ncbi:hypothetical protein GCM10027261_02910 [Geodermatophilus arenarius]